MSFFLVVELTKQVISFSFSVIAPAASQAAYSFTTTMGIGFIFFTHRQQEKTVWHTILYDECAARRAAEVSIQPTGQEAYMLFFIDTCMKSDSSIYEGTIGRL